MFQYTSDEKCDSVCGSLENDNEKCTFIPFMNRVVKAKTTCINSKINPDWSMIGGKWDEKAICEDFGNIHVSRPVSA